jgi:hypothetical protein
MIIYTIGVIVIATVLAVGVFWLLSNVTFTRTTQRYTYKIDEEGNAVVTDENGKILPKESNDA